MRKSLALLLVIFLYSNFAYALDLNYGRAKALVLENSRLLKAYKEEAEAAKYQRRQAVGGYMPSVTISETYSKTDEPGAAAFAKMKQGGFTMPYFQNQMANPPKVTNWSTTVEVMQPIYMQGRIYYGLRQASLAERAAEDSVELARQHLILNFHKAFYGYALARQALDTTESSFERTRRYYGMTKDFYENGIIVKSDLLVAETYLLQAEQAVKEAERQYAVAESQLQRLLDTDEDLSSVECDKPGLDTSESLDFYISTAYKKRKDLQAMNKRLKVMKYEKSKAKSGFMPEVYLFASYEQNGDDSFGDDGKGTTVGGKVSFNVFNGFKDYNSVKAAGSRHMAHLHRIADKKLQIKSEVKSAFYGKVAADKKVNTANKRLESAETALQITENRFKEGLSKITELLDREVDVKNAKLFICTSDYEKIVAESELLFSSGLLN